MSEPKIKYDIEAAVKGTADADGLARSLRDVGDVLEGDLQKSAQDAALALEALGSKQRALETFQRLKNESGALAIELAEARGNLQQMDAQLSQASDATQRFVQAELGAKAALASKRAELASARKAYDDMQVGTLGAARKTDEYRIASQGAKEKIQQLSAEIGQHVRSVRELEASSRTAQQAENQLSAQHQKSATVLVQARAAVDANTAAMDAGRESLRAVGVEANNLAQAERNLQGALAQVRQEVASMAPAYQQAAAASSQSTQIQAQNQRTLRDGMTSISTQLARIQQVATVALGGSYVGGLAKSVAETADEFKNLEARVKLATGEGPLFQAAFAGVQQVALDTNSALDETGTLFARLAKAGQEAGQSAQLAQTNALQLTKTINQSIQLSGGSADSSKAAITQLIQGLQSGVLRGEEFNSVMEQAPRLAQAMANGLSVTTGELRTLAGQGALTAETVMRALRGQADVVAGEFAKLPPTVGRALQNLTTQWTLYVGQSDNGLVSSANAAKVINALAGNLDTLVTSLTAAGKLWAAFKIAGLASDFGAWALKTMSATAAIEKNTVAVVSNTAAQAGNAAAHATNTAAQTANVAATTASTAARTANAASWASIATFAGQASKATTAATAATVANTAAVAGKSAAFGILGTAVRGVTGLLGGPVGLVATVLLFSGEIKKGTTAVFEWAMGFTEAGQAMKRYQAQEKAATDEQIRHTEARKANAAALLLQSERMAEARNRTFDLTKQAIGLVAEFDKVRAGGDSAAEAVAKIGKDFDLSNSQGIRTATGVLDKLRADGKITAEEFQAAWAKALDGQDLAKFEVLARNAFTAASAEAEKLREQIQKAIQSGASEAAIKAMEEQLKGLTAAAGREAERVAQMMDNVLREAVKRTGLEYDQLQGKIGATSRSALNDIDVIVNGMGQLRSQGVDVGRVLAATFTKAIDTADSQQAIDALRTRIEGLRTASGNTAGDAIAGGLLDQLKQKAEELKAKLDEVKPGINSVAEAMKNLGMQSTESLQRTAAQAQQAYGVIAEAGAQEGESYLAWQRRKEAAALAMIQRMLEANRGVVDANISARAAAAGLRIDADEGGRVIVRSMRSAEEATHRAGRAAGGAAGQYQAMGQSAAQAAEQTKRLSEIHNRNRLDSFEESSAKIQKDRDTHTGNILVPQEYIDAEIAKRYGEDMVGDKKAEETFWALIRSNEYLKYGGPKSEQGQKEAHWYRQAYERLDAELQKRISEKSQARGSDEEQDVSKKPLPGETASTDQKPVRRRNSGGGEVGSEGPRSGAARQATGTPVHLHFNGENIGAVSTDTSGREVLQKLFTALSDGKRVAGR